MKGLRPKGHEQPCFGPDLDSPFRSVRIEAEVAPLDPAVAVARSDAVQKYNHGHGPPGCGRPARHLSPVAVCAVEASGGVPQEAGAFSIAERPPQPACERRLDRVETLLEPLPHLDVDLDALRA